MKPLPACWMLGFCLALGSTTPSLVRAQVPTVQNQPRLAVPVTRAVVEQAPSATDTVAPAAQPPGQPTAAPAPQPVTQVTGTTGVTSLPSGSGTTTSSSQAATADYRSYSASRFALTLDGVQLGSVRSVDGGTAFGSVVTDQVGPSQIPGKHLANIAYEDISIETDLQSKQLDDWIAASWTGNVLRKSGSIQNADVYGTIQSEREFANALIVETTMPALDAASKNVARVTVKLAPEYTRMKSGGTKLQSSSKAQNTWLVSNFRFEMAGLDGTKVSKIDGFTVSQRPVQDGVGEARDYQKTPGTINFPNLKITLATSSAQSWGSWYDNFLLKGNNGQDQERSGAIVYLDASRTIELGRVNLSQCGIFRLAPEKMEAGTETIARTVAELYCERMELVTTK